MAVAASKAASAIKGPDLTARGRTLVEILRPYWVPASVSEAQRYLHEHVAPVRLIGLYKHYFPDEYRRSEASMTVQPGEMFAEAEKEFFRLVDNRLFPLYEDGLDYLVEEYAAEWRDVDYLDEGEGRPDPRDFAIPVMPTGLPGWRESWPQDYRAGWRLLMAAVAGAARDDRENLPAPLTPELLDAAGQLNLFSQAPGGWARLDWTRLSELCVGMVGEDTPLRALPNALNMLDCDTGCVFLDAFPDEALGPTVEAYWTREDMDWLIEEYKKANEYDAPVYRFLEWLETDGGHMHRTIDLLKGCIVEDPGEGRVRIGV